MAIGDIYYVLFRHKWKILLLSLLGFVAAVLFYFLKPPPFQSSAELLIQYVPQAGAMSMMGSDQKVIVPDARGDDIINSEIQIMTSLDLAQVAVNNFGASNILAKAGGGGNVTSAAYLIWNNLRAEPAVKGSSVIVVTLKHPDSQVVQPVLKEIITDYFQRHREIHSVGGQFDDALSKEKTALSLQLDDTEQQLANLKNKFDILSLDDSRKGLTDQITKIQGAIWDAQAELVGYEAAMNHTTGLVSNALETTTNTAPTVIPSDQVEAYKSISARIDALRRKQQEYLVQGFTSSNSLVQEVNAQISDTQNLKDDLLKKYPQIADTAPSPGGPSAVRDFDPKMQAAQVAALQAKLKVWETQLDQLQLQASNLNSQAPEIARLEQTRAIQQANYQNLATGIEKSHVDQALDTGKAPNIKWVQYPSPPSKDSRKTYKTMGMLAFGGILAGLAWAFLIEFVLDPFVPAANRN